MAEDDAKLSQDEIDSLLNGSADGNDGPSQSGRDDNRQIRPFDPTTQRRAVRGRLHTLEIINERFTRHFRMSLFNLMRRNADITAGAVNILKYSEFTHNLPTPANLNVIRMKPLRGDALVVFPPDLVFLVVDNLFGGDGRFVMKAEGREFTRTEQRVIRRLLALALESYSQGWQDVYPLDIEFSRSEMQPKFTNITSSDNELVVDSTFHIEIGTFAGDFHICMPFAMIEPIHDLLAGPLQKRDPDEEHDRLQRMAGEIKQSHVRLVADFTHIRSTLGEVARLRVGDVLPIEPPRELTARVDDIPVLRCDFGNLNGHKALRVIRVINHTAETSHGGQDNDRLE